jgi:hypothetical protein
MSSTTSTLGLDTASSTVSTSISSNSSQSSSSQSSHPHEASSNPSFDFFPQSAPSSSFSAHLSQWSNTSNLFSTVQSTPVLLRHRHNTRNQPYTSPLEGETPFSQPAPSTPLSTSQSHHASPFSNSISSQSESSTKQKSEEQKLNEQDNDNPSSSSSTNTNLLNLVGPYELPIDEHEKPEMVELLNKHRQLFTNINNLYKEEYIQDELTQKQIPIWKNDMELYEQFYNNKINSTVPLQDTVIDLKKRFSSFIKQTNSLSLTSTQKNMRIREYLYEYRSTVQKICNIIIEIDKEYPKLKLLYDNLYEIQNHHPLSTLPQPNNNLNSPIITTPHQLQLAAEQLSYQQQSQSSYSRPLPNSNQSQYHLQTATQSPITQYNSAPTTPISYYPPPPRRSSYGINQSTITFTPTSSQYPITNPNNINESQQRINEINQANRQANMNINNNNPNPSQQPNNHFNNNNGVPPPSPPNINNNSNQIPPPPPPGPSGPPDPNINTSVFDAVQLPVQITTPRPNYKPRPCRTFDGLKVDPLDYLQFEMDMTRMLNAAYIGIHGEQSKVVAAQYLTDDAAHWYSDEAFYSSRSWQELSDLMKRKYIPPETTALAQAKANDIRLLPKMTMNRFNMDFNQIIRLIPFSPINDQLFLQIYESDLQRSTSPLASFVLTQIRIKKLDRNSPLTTLRATQEWASAIANTYIDPQHTAQARSQFYAPLGDTINKRLSQFNSSTNQNYNYSSPFSSRPMNNYQNRNQSNNTKMNNNNYNRNNKYPSRFPYRPNTFATPTTNPSLNITETSDFYDSCENQNYSNNNNNEYEYEQEYNDNYNEYNNESMNLDEIPTEQLNVMNRYVKYNNNRTISQNEIENRKKENRCYHCGLKGHFANTCSTMINGKYSKTNPTYDSQNKTSSSSSSSSSSPSTQSQTKMQ